MQNFFQFQEEVKGWKADQLENVAKAITVMVLPAHYAPSATGSCSAAAQPACSAPWGCRSTSPGCSVLRGPSASRR